MATLLGNPKVQYFKTGTVDYLSGGKVYSYVAGTTTPIATYPTIADALAGTNPNTNPVILDSRGEANIVIQGPTKLILKDANDNTIWTVDNIEQAASDIIDENGNELLKFITTASAVNEWTITNAATAGKPRFQASGGDTNITGQILSKGAGDLELDGGSSGALELNKNSTGNINLRRAATCHDTLTCNGTLTCNDTLTCSDSITMSDATKTFTLLPAGVVSWFAGSSVPSGWLECDGSAVSRTTYPALFSAIGTTFGAGNGSTTFNLPNQARRVLVGRGGTGTSTLANTIGATGGSETHTLTIAEMPAHTHSYLSSNVGTAAGANQTVSERVGTATTGSTGGGGAHNNMQPSLVMMMIIRAY